MIKKNWRILFFGLILILDSWISVLELKPKEKDFGFLSLNRAIALDRLLTFLVQTLSVLCFNPFGLLESIQWKKTLAFLVLWKKR